MLELFVADGRRDAVATTAGLAAPTAHLPLPWPHPSSFPSPCSLAFAGSARRPARRPRAASNADADAARAPLHVRHVPTMTSYMPTLMLAGCQPVSEFA